MGHPVQFQPEEWETFELTFRCLQARLLMKPGDEANRRFLGCLGRALLLSAGKVRLYFASGTSNHGHLIIAALNAEARAAFKRHLKTNLSKELGRLYAWKERLFGRRTRDIYIAPDALEDRLMYCAAHGVKENLVDCPRSWPGVQWPLAATEGKPLRGHWYRRTEYGNALRSWRRRGKQGPKPRLQTYTDVHFIELHPLPGQEDWTVEARQTWWTALVARALEAYPRPKDRLPLGAEKVLAADPHQQPEAPKRSAAPFIHSRDPEAHDARRAAFRVFLQERHAAIEGILAGELTLNDFPRAGIPPSWWGAVAAPGLPPDLQAASAL